MVPMAATGLLIDPAWKSVSVVTGAPVSTSAIPYPFAQWISKSLITARLTPGTPKRSMSSSRERAAMESGWASGSPASIIRI